MPKDVKNNVSEISDQEHSEKAYNKERIVIEGKKTESEEKFGQQCIPEVNNEESRKQYLNPQVKILVEADDNTEVSGATNEYLESDKSNMPLVRFNTCEIRLYL